jgi:hypothetical protein
METASMSISCPIAIQATDIIFSKEKEPDK